MKLLLDMNLTPRWVEWLAREDVDAVHWMSVGQAAADDSEIMAYARANELIVATSDLDFGDLLAASLDDRPSVVIIRAPDTRPEAVGKHLLAALASAETELAGGALILMTPGRARMRILPLKS